MKTMCPNPDTCLIPHLCQTPCALLINSNKDLRYFKPEVKYIIRITIMDLRIRSPKSEIWFRVFVFVFFSLIGKYINFLCVKLEVITKTLGF